MEEYDALDLFAGPGGWDEGARNIGLRTLGFEWDAAACNTRRAAGHATVEGDVRAAIGWLERVIARGLIGSPPCQPYSKAGKGEGRKALDRVLEALAAMDEGRDADLSGLDEKVTLVLEPLRWILRAFELGRPFEWVALEQVPQVLPVWEALAEVLRRRGYEVVTGVLSAEQHGVAQTRKRAILAARLGAPVSFPDPTHSRYHSRTPDRLDADVLPWVSMAEALVAGGLPGWDADDLIGFPRRDDGREGGAVEIDGEKYRARDLRPASAPAFVLTEKARSWHRFIAFCATNVRPNSAVRPATEPAPTLAFGHETPNWLIDDKVNNQSGTDFDLVFQAQQPATVVAGREVVPFRGANANRFNGATKSRNDGFKVTPEEASVLQSFPASYPWQGGRTKVFEQIGNAVPPLLASAVLSALVGGE